MFNETAYGDGLGDRSAKKLAKIALKNPERAARLAARQSNPGVYQPITLPNQNAGGGAAVPGTGQEFAAQPAPADEPGLLDSITGVFKGIPKNYIIIGAVVAGFLLLKKR